ncbi:hypothetical protein KIS4809_1018 [Bacillus sp. ZZV12-4809]|nr:hypothetical protein KIS4809_1018 [Bacillus sp. ZZV12-4809]
MDGGVNVTVFNKVLYQKKRMGTEGFINIFVLFTFFRQIDKFLFLYWVKSVIVFSISRND